MAVSFVADATRNTHRTADPALKGRAKFMPTLRVENLFTRDVCGVLTQSLVRESGDATLVRVKKEMALPRVAKSAREALLRMAEQ